MPFPYSYNLILKHFEKKNYDYSLHEWAGSKSPLIVLSASLSLINTDYITFPSLFSVVRVGDLNAKDPGSNPQLGLLNGFVLGDTRGKFITLCK